MRVEIERKEAHKQIIIFYDSKCDNFGYPEKRVLKYIGMGQERHFGEDDIFVTY